MEILKRQVNHAKLLLEKQLLNRDVYTLIAIVIKKWQCIFGAFSIVAKLFKSTIK